VYAKPDERILVLARYHHLKPTALKKRRRALLKLADFMTIHASKGQQADHVIVVGLKEGERRFPCTGAGIRDGRGVITCSGRFPGCRGAAFTVRGDNPRAIACGSCSTKRSRRCLSIF
jgi:superfamily I DNA/RNA helicase